MKRYVPKLKHQTFKQSKHSTLTPNNSHFFLNVGSKFEEQTNSRIHLVTQTNFKSLWQNLQSNDERLNFFVPTQTITPRFKNRSCSKTQTNKPSCQTKPNPLCRFLKFIIYKESFLSQHFCGFRRVQIGF